MKMPNLDAKGIVSSDWLFKVLWGICVFFVIDVYNQVKEDRKSQGNINKEIITTLNQIQQNSAATSRDNAYIIQEIKEMKTEIKEIKRDYQLKR